MSIRDNLDISAYLVLGPENTLGRPVGDVVAQALDAGFTCIQVRSKVASAREIIALTGDAAQVIAQAGQANPGSGCDARKIDLAQRSRNGIAHHDAQQNRHNLDHAATPNIADDDYGDGNHGNEPVGLAVGNSGACQDQTDRNDDGASHHRREEAHDALGTKRTEERREHRIEQAGAGNAQTSVGQKLGLAVGRNRGIASDKGKRRAQEGRYLTARQEVEQERAQAGKQKRRRYRETGEHGHQYRGAKHGKQMLQTEQEHARAAKRRCIVDGIGDGGRRRLGHKSPFEWKGTRA